MTPLHALALEPFKKHPDKSLLVLDFDGSHAPFVTNADDARMYKGLRERIIASHKKGFNIAFSSGRELSNLVSIVGIPHIKDYAGSHGNHLLVRGEERDYMPSERIREEFHNIYQQDIIEQVKPGFDYHVEKKPASIVLHWRDYCEKHSIKGDDLRTFEARLFKEHINPAIEAYNSTETNPAYHLKAENHGMNADISPVRSRNKGDALDDFAIDRLLQKQPIYDNILTVNDSLTDGHMIKKADEFKKAYGTNTVNVIVEQASTPKEMMIRHHPDIILYADRDKDPELRLGGIPKLHEIYDYLLR